MAGIGFALRSLMRKDTLWSIFESQLHGIIAVAGPWFFTIIGMALPSLMFKAASAEAPTAEFVTLLLYIFSLSLTLTSPIAIGLTRHVSDCLYQQRDREVAASLVGAVLLGLATAVPVVAFGVAHLQAPLETRLLAAMAYGLVTMNWIVAPLLSTIRQFRALTLAYAAGTTTFWLMIRGLRAPSVPELLIGFNLGMCATNALVCGLVLHNFPGRTWLLLPLLRAMRRYWDLLLGGFLYGAGIWVDKWLMWRAPEGTAVAGGLHAYPTYDTVAFIAYVSTVPALSLFIIQAETAFHERCQDLYGAIADHADLRTLERARQAALLAFRTAGRDVGLLQLCITTLILLLPVPILDAAGIPQIGVFMLRFCALGAAFQSGVLMLTIVLHYFDSRRTVLQINALFVVANALLTALSVRLGLGWHGFGYFLACLTTFAVAYGLVMRTFRDLLYLAFVRQNAAVTEAPLHAASRTVFAAE